MILHDLFIDRRGVIVLVTQKVFVAAGCDLSGRW